jgi:hypothetical protein
VQMSPCEKIGSDVGGRGVRPTETRFAVAPNAASLAPAGYRHAMGAAVVLDLMSAVATAAASTAPHPQSEIILTARENFRHGS